MKYLRLLSWLLCCTVLMFSLASCEEQRARFNKERNGYSFAGYLEANKFNDLENNKLIFMSNGDIIGYWKMGGKKRVFYTENNCHLFVFVKGLGIKLSNWTYEHYYKIDGNKLTLWFSLNEMNSNNPDCLIFQKEK